MGRVRNKDQIQLAGRLPALASIVGKAHHDQKLNPEEQEARSRQLISQRYSSPYGVMGGRQGCFILYADHEEALARIAEVLAKNFKQAVSEKYIFDRLISIVRNEVESGAIGQGKEDRLRQSLLELICESKKAIKTFKALIPIRGLWLNSSVESLTIGQVTFKSATLDELKSISRDYFDSSFTDVNFGEVKAVGEVDVLAGDDEAIREQAEFKVLLALDILRIIFYRHRWLLAGGLTLDLVGGLPQRVVFYKKTEQGEQEYRFFAWGVNAGRRSVLGAPLEITELHRAIIRDSGFHDFNGLFERDTGEVIGRLQRSIQWCSEATLEVDTARSFLKQAIALETLLGGGSGAIAELIAKRVAFLVSNDMQKRIEARDKVKELYNKYRPKIAHGSSTMPPLKELHEFQDYVVTSIIRYANLFREQTSWQGVKDWFDQQKFT